MCGIAGIVDPIGCLSERDVAPSLTAQSHRGPDADGAWSDGFCALGHRRLAIIDLSEAGRQPMANAAGTLQITFNGEIYNFQQLRAELEGLGYRFRTRTDTEVILYAYEQWGIDCLKRLRGMFAFGIWDASQRRLFLARDRVGKKPLFYTEQATRRDGGRSFAFASELQGLLADGSVPRTVDLEALDAYLAWGYIPAPCTGFRGVRKLEPGGWLTVDVTPEGLVIDTGRYWQLEYGPKLRIDEREACEALREKLTEAVRLRMISDVPLGAFLSGGIDSSLVVGLMAGLSQQPVKTFSIGFHEQGYNELPHARRIAERWSTDHHELVVRPDALAILPLLVRHYGEPYADSSAIPTFYVAQITRRDVTVALNGDGGDESFAGYDRYWANRMAERLARIPGSRHAAHLLSRALPDSLERQNRLRRARRFFTVASRPMVERYAHWVTFFDAPAKSSLYSSEMRGQLNGARPIAWLESLFDRFGELDPGEAAMAVDVLSYLPYDLLVKVDITSMANSLEGRSPFLDHEVMEFTARLPFDLKLRGKEAKYLLRRAFPDLLPPENVNRPKMGFAVPVGHWFCGPMRELLCDALLSRRSQARGYFEAPVVQRLVNEHLGKKADHSYLLWSLLILELWHCEMIDVKPMGVVA